MKKSQKGETMTYAVAINSSGQATIPKAIRQLLNIVPGENRLTFDVVNGEVVLGREASAKEKLMASIARIEERNRQAELKNPEITKAKEKYKGMTFNEIRDAYDATPEGKKEFEEKYGIKL
ncbi:AbrB/MazE/SpoVT family DNA-binding domain-containing protein [Candidatus Saccharibacteria bacterium]|nr:AbrB/MazE/SpoVT family DNA-binding domain-containing protein [Candidatus Saccharibacteria bacterium]